MRKRNKHILLNIELEQAVEKYCNQNQTNFSEVVRRLLIELMEDKGLLPSVS